MADFQGTFFFRDTGRSFGWTESYYLTSTNHNTAATTLGLLATDRLAFMDPGNYLDQIRVSDINIERDSVLVLSSPRPGTATIAAGVKGTDPWTALMFRVESGFAYRGRKYCHGCLNDIALSSRAYDGTNPNDAAVQSYIANLVGNFKLKTKDTVGPPVVHNLQVISQVLPQRLVEHRVGRPFGLLVGRRAI